MERRQIAWNYPQGLHRLGHWQAPPPPPWFADLLIPRPSAAANKPRPAARPPILRSWRGRFSPRPRRRFPPPRFKKEPRKTPSELPQINPGTPDQASKSPRPFPCPEGGADTLGTGGGGGEDEETHSPEPTGRIWGFTVELWMWPSMETPPMRQAGLQPSKGSDSACHPLPAIL